MHKRLDLVFDFLQVICVCCATLAEANAFHSLPLRNIIDNVETELSITCPEEKRLNSQLFHRS